MANLKDYEEEAKKVYEGQYATKVQNIKDQQASQLNQYKNDETGYNKLYDGYLKDNKTAGIKNRNDYNAQTLSRGLGRSSIATTGLTGINLATDKAGRQLNDERASKLQQLYNARDLYNQQVAGQLNALESEKIGAVSEYARKLYEAQLQRDLQLQLAEMSRASYGGYSSGGGYDNEKELSDSKMRDALNQSALQSIYGNPNYENAVRAVENYELFARQTKLQDDWDTYNKLKKNLDYYRQKKEYVSPVKNPYISKEELERWV